MSLNPSDPGKIPVQYNTIKKKEAIRRTSLWRKTIARLMGVEEKSEKIPRSFTIPIETFKQIISDFNTMAPADAELNGVRVYLTLEQEDQFQITGLVVPTYKIAGTDAEVYNDLVVNVPGPGGSDPADDDDGNVSTYDFTKPCPTFCGGSDPELNQDIAP